MPVNEKEEPDAQFDWSVEKKDEIFKKARSQTRKEKRKERKKLSPQALGSWREATPFGLLGAGGSHEIRKMLLFGLSSYYVSIHASHIFFSFDLIQLAHILYQVLNQFTTRQQTFSVQFKLANKFENSSNPFQADCEMNIAVIAAFFSDMSFLVLFLGRLFSCSSWYSKKNRKTEDLDCAVSSLHWLMIFL
jgi:hypothetical protein